jgi:hypothetical protein
LNNISHQRRNFIKKSSLLIGALAFAKFDGFAAPFVLGDPTIIPNIPQVILNDPKVQLKFDPEVMIINDGLQPTMLSTKKGTLIVQSQHSKKPLPQQRIFYPYGMSNVVSRDGGKTWKDFPLPAGENGVNMEGGIIQLKDGTIIALETYVTPGEKPETGEGLLYQSKDDYQTLQGPFKITFNIPKADFYKSTDDMGRPHVAMRLHRRIVELPNGDLLTTIYGFQEGDTEPSGYNKNMMRSRVMLFKSTNKGRHWDFVSVVAAGRGIGTEGYGEPVLVRVSKGRHAGRLICQMRTGRDLYETISGDGGKTWSTPKPRVFAGIDVYNTAEWAEMFKDVKRNGVLISENPNEFIGAVVDPDLIELRSGILVAAFGVRIPARANFSKPEHPWNGNYIAFSLDGGDTWSQVTRLTTGVSTTHYMCIEETPKDNEVFVVYDFGHWTSKIGRYTYGRRFKIDAKIKK